MVLLIDTRTYPLIHPGEGLPVSQQEDISDYLSRISKRRAEETEEKRSRQREKEKDGESEWVNIRS